MGISTHMEIRKVIQRRIRRRGDGVDLASDVNAVISANIGRDHSPTHVSSKQTAASRQGGGNGQGQAEER